MYKCLKCGNMEEFEEVNIVRTYVKQKDNNFFASDDEFMYREDVVCLECGYNMDDGYIKEY